MSKSNAMSVQMPTEPRQTHPSKEIGGSAFPQFNNILINAAIRAFFVPDGAHGESWRESAIDTVLIALKGLKPQNELEGMLAAQIVAAHAASMECYRRAALDEQTFEGREMSLTHAAKATRSFALLIETLQKLRGETGTQSIHVHHHHTDARMQLAAERATVNVGGVQEGEKAKNGEQPHERAAIAHNPGEAVDLGAAMRREEPRGEAVPVSRDARQEAVPPARREKSRRAEGTRKRQLP